MPDLAKEKKIEGASISALKMGQTKTGRRKIDSVLMFV
jgi:hypothetical protein